MTDKNSHELLESARRFRAMANSGDDPALKVALLQLAEEFEREAAELDAAASSMTDMKTPADTKSVKWIDKGHNDDGTVTEGQISTPPDRDGSGLCCFSA